MGERKGYAVYVSIFILKDGWNLSHMHKMDLWPHSSTEYSS